jgi:hypothetical protein
LKQRAEGRRAPRWCRYSGASRTVNSALAKVPVTPADADTTCRRWRWRSGASSEASGKASGSKRLPHRQRPDCRCAVQRDIQCKRARNVGVLAASAYFRGEGIRHGQQTVCDEAAARKERRRCSLFHQIPTRRRPRPTLRLSAAGRKRLQSKPLAHQYGFDRLTFGVGQSAIVDQNLTHFAAGSNGSCTDSIPIIADGRLEALPRTATEVTK